ncbi:MAG: carbohydrate binding family 9 domain-containing protein [Candidatus Aminicenantes bacterium]|nr:carbohydrate binding family 9 domain-containing protein [Candidatus Aminicenantes bacterium]
MKIRQKTSVVLGALLCFLLLPSSALPAEKTIHGLPKLSEAPKIDGVLDNPVWEQEALKIEDFFQMTPKEMGQPTERTAAYIGYDEKNLYIAFRCYDSDPSKIRASVTSRDNSLEDDWILLMLDTFNEKQRAFGFMINPLGVQTDFLRIESGGNDNMDLSWDMVFESAGRIDGEGYVVEIALPFKGLRFPDRQEKIWGLVIGRNIPRIGEIIIWPGVTREIPGLLAQAAEISFSGKVEKGGNFEIMPVFTSLKTKNTEVNPEAGLNFKWGVSSDLTLDATVNPDFSHIEADAPQIEANQRFALYYPEKRPFFLEGMEIFGFPEMQLIYTRRIIDPAAGAKLTGKVGRFTYGLITAYDENPTESLWDVSEGGGMRDDNALFNIFRMKVDVFNESYLGFCLTDKKIDGSFNRVAGVDGRFKFKKNFFFSFQAVASKTKYSEKETRAVPAVYSELNYIDKYWGGGLYWESRHPDFEASAGFVNRVDYRTYGGFTYFNIYPRKKFISQIRLSLSSGRRFAYFADTLVDQWVEGNLQWRLTELSQVFISYRNSMERFGNIDFHKNSLEAEGSIDVLGWLPFGFYFRTGDSIYYDPEEPFLGNSNVYGLTLNFKPNKRIRLSVDFWKETFWENQGGEQIFDYNVVRNSLYYQVSKTLSLRTIVDYNHFDKKLYGSFLFSWILKPGTVFFFGVDNDLSRDDFGHYFQNDYSVFVKFSYWWRL